MLGRQQIANISTAISELFKNSYDAYADNIEADYFRYSNLFILRDNGFGMTEEEFTERWLAVGTESKYGKEGGMKSLPLPEGKTKRPMMGEKGIGRLAISTIGSQVLVLSRAEREGKPCPTVAAFLNWRIFESPGIDLDQIEIPVLPYPTGTLPNREEVLILVDFFRDNIKNLKEKIPEKLQKEILDDLDRFDFDPIATDEHLSALSLKENKKKTALSLLKGNTGTHFYIQPSSTQLSSEIDEQPEGGGSAPLIKTLIGFINSMKLPAESENGQTKVSEQTKENPAAPALTIKTAFRDHKKADLYEDLINSQNFFTREDFKLTDHLVEGAFDDAGDFDGSVKIYKQNPVTHHISKPKGMRGKTDCGSFGIKFGYVQGTQAESSLSKEDYATITGKIERIGGLYIYKDDIRVQPYGSYDIDYLGLEVRRSKKASYYFFSYRRLFGFVEVSREENPELAEKAGREGFIDNDAYKQFKKLLVNLFLQLAIDFFRDEGQDLGGFQEAKAEFKKQDEIRRDREKETREARTKLRNDLNKIIEKLDEEIPARDLNETVEEFSESVEKLKATFLPEEFADRLLKAEKTYKKKIKNVRDRYYIEKPKIGLDEKLRKSWEYYRNEFLDFEKNDWAKARARISSVARDALKSKNIASPIRKWALENSQIRLKEQSADIGKKIIEVKNLMSSLLHRVEQTNKSFQNESKSLEDNLRMQLIQGKEDSFHEAFNDFDTELEKLADEEKFLLTNLQERAKDLQRIFEDDGNGQHRYTLNETIAALEEENLDLKIRYDESVELAQLGMSVSVIGHEFGFTINSIRTFLSRLSNWAEQNPELDDLYNGLRREFDHLDEYLRMFTPLQRRLYRSEVEIEGGQIVAYLRQVFAAPLLKHNTEIINSDRFTRSVIIGYPSTFYPVFINLTDNAIFWLKDRPVPRTISLDAKKDGTIVFSDNGPGIHPADRESVFEAGFTRKPGGRGLGLNISREVLNKAGYELELDDSSKGKGTVFLIRHKAE